MARNTQTARLAKLRNNAVGPMIQGSGAKSGGTPLWVPVATGASVLGSFWAATEAFAIHFKFQEALGGLHIGPVYQPLQIIPWSLHYASQFPNPTKVAGFVGMGTFFASAVAIAAKRKRIAQTAAPNHFLHGSARWMDLDGLEQASLLFNDGVYVGGWVDPDTGKFYFLRHDGPEHVLTIAPTRSGKGIGLVLPTLYSWKHSAVVADLKGELTALTSGHRASVLGNDVLVFKPASMETTHRWNPLEEIRMDTAYETADVQNLAQMIVDPNGRGIEEHFDRIANSMFVGVILHALYRHTGVVRRPLEDEHQHRVAQRATEAKSYDVLVRREGQDDSVVEYKVAIGNPVPIIGKDGYVHQKLTKEAVNLYDLEIVDAIDDGVFDPKFPKRPAVKGKVGHVLIDYDYEQVDYPVSGNAPNMYELDRLLADPARPVTELWKEMLNYDHYPEPRKGGVGPNRRTHPAVAATARDMIDRPVKEAGSAVSTAKGFLSLYRDPVVARNTEKSDFKIEDLMYGQKPATLYIVTQATDKDRLRPLVRTMLNMFVRVLAPEQDYVNGKPELYSNHRLLFMIDEFPTLGKLEIIQGSLAFVASFGLKFYLITQDLPQLKHEQLGYGANETISSNAQVRNYYAPNTHSTAEKISEDTGVTTVVNENISVSGKKGLFGGAQTVTTSYSETARALMTPDEVERLKAPRKDATGNITEAGDMLIYVAGHPMIYGKQILFWEHQYFLDASRVPPAPIVEYGRVAWIDRRGRTRYSLMSHDEADRLETQLRTDFDAVPPPKGRDNRWAIPAGPISASPLDRSPASATETVPESLHPAGFAFQLKDSVRKSVRTAGASPASAGLDDEMRVHSRQPGIPSCDIEIE